jgi:hypothetical protein
MLNINIQTIPHDEQRYETVGDYWMGTDAVMQFRVSEMDNWRFELAIAVHELVEWGLVKLAGVSLDEIDDFDKAFEARRDVGDFSEPGDDPQAPYHTQHCIATGVERILIACLGVSWKEYDDAVNAL